MSGFKSILDEDGNINTSILTKELKTALEHDVRYKQTDNMKKRAVKTAVSYDEFKAMVSCAHLKKISRKEVESLSEIKKGWKKPSVTKKEAASILEEESKLEQQLKKATISESVVSIVSKSQQGKSSVKSCMELERDLRRIQSDEGKWEYLLSVGISRVMSLLKKGADVDLIEEILRIVTFIHSNDNQDNNPDTSIIINWLQDISQLDKFALTIKFADRSLISQIQELLSHNEVSSHLRETYGLACVEINKSGY